MAVVEEDVAGDSDAECDLGGGRYGYLDWVVRLLVFGGYGYLDWGWFVGFGGYGYLDSGIGLGRAGFKFAGASIVFGWMSPDDSS